MRRNREEVAKGTVFHRIFISFVHTFLFSCCAQQKFYATLCISVICVVCLHCGNQAIMLACLLSFFQASCCHSFHSCSSKFPNATLVPQFYFILAFHTMQWSRRQSLKQNHLITFSSLLIPARDPSHYHSSLLRSERSFSRAGLPDRRE